MPKVKEIVKGFCDHCWSWGNIVDTERNMCDDCKQREIARTNQERKGNVKKG